MKATRRAISKGEKKKQIGKKHRRIFPRGVLSPSPKINRYFKIHYVAITGRFPVYFTVIVTRFGLCISIDSEGG